MVLPPNSIFTLLDYVLVVLFLKQKIILNYNFLNVKSIKNQVFFHCFH